MSTQSLCPSLRANGGFYSNFGRAVKFIFLQNGKVEERLFQCPCLWVTYRGHAVSLPNMAGRGILSTARARTTLDGAARQAYLSLSTSPSSSASLSFSS